MKWWIIVGLPIWLLVLDCLLRVRRVFKLMEEDLRSKRQANQKLNGGASE